MKDYMQTESKEKSKNKRKEDYDDVRLQEESEEMWVERLNKMRDLKKAVN